MEVRDIELWDGAGGYKVIITAPKSAELPKAVEKFRAGKKLDFELKEHRERRSLDSNAYAWVLMHKLAETLSERKCKPFTAVEIYRQYVRDFGPFEIVPLRNDAIDAWVKIWEARGLGWVCEKQDSKLTGFTNAVTYYGSSVYDKKQMARLIEAIVADCKELGIQTLTPREIAELNARWGE